MLGMAHMSSISAEGRWRGAGVGVVRDLASASRASSLNSGAAFSVPFLTFQGVTEG